MRTHARLTEGAPPRAERFARALTTLSVSAAALATLAPRAARAQGNYHSAPIGGRSALMGNTGVALGRDGAAPFLNPATIVRINDHRLAFSVNFYSFTANSLHGWHQPGPVDASRFGALSIEEPTFSNSSFNALPSTLCVFLTVAGVGDDSEARGEDKPIGAQRRAGRQKLAACLATVERQEFGFTADGFRAGSAGITTHQTQSILRTWSRFMIGPTYAIDVSDSFSIGASIHGIATTYRNIWSTSSVTYDAQNRAISSSFNKGARGLSIDLGAIVGAAYRFSGNTIGLAFHTPTLHVLGSSGSTYHSQYSGTGDATAMGAGTGTFAAPSPPRVSLGIGHELSWGVIEANASYAFPMLDGLTARISGTEVTVATGQAAERASEVNVSERFRGVFNASLGTEYFVNPSFSVLAGFSTDLSAVPDLAGTGTSLATFTQAKTTRVAASVGLGTHSTGGDFLIGTELSHGWGQTFAVNNYQLPPNFVVVDHSTFGVLLVIAGTTSLRSIKKVVDNVGDMVAPAKK